MDKLEAVKGQIASLYAAQRTLKAIAPEYGWSGLGNLLGDFGEFVAVNHYGLEKAPPGAAGYDALTGEGKRVQIKTNHSSETVGYRGEADLFLALKVFENGEWEEIYYGDFGLVKENSGYSKRDNKRTITVKKLRALASRGSC